MKRITGFKSTQGRERQSEEQTTGNVKGCKGAAARAIRASVGYLRWAILSLSGLFLAASTFAQAPKLLYYDKQGPAIGPVVATTAPSSPCCRAAYIVSMSQKGAGGPVQLYAWNDAGTMLVNIAKENWNPGSGNPLAYGIATLDANRVVTAYVDETSTLYLGVWAVGYTTPSVFYLQGQSSVTASGPLGPLGNQGVSVTALSSSEVVTATEDPSGDLRVQTWNIDASGSVTQQSTEVAGSIYYPYVVAINANQVVTAADSLTGNVRKLIVWKIGSDGGITRQGSLGISNTNSSPLLSGMALAPLGGFLGNYEVMTVAEAIINGQILTEVQSWNISSTGQVTQGLTGTDIQKSDTATGIAWTPNLNPFTATLVSDDGETGGIIEMWKNSGTTKWTVFDSNYLGGNSPSALSSVSVAAEGTDSSRAYFVVAYVGAAGNLNVQVWSAPF
jgi:hypothetical protein